MRETADIYPPPQFAPTVMIHEAGDDLFQSYAMKWVVRLRAAHVFDYILLTIQPVVIEYTWMWLLLWENKRTTPKEWFFLAGGDDRIRTGDLGLDRAAC